MVFVGVFPMPISESLNGTLREVIDPPESGSVAPALHLDVGQKGLMVAAPVLAGAILRVASVAMSALMTGLVGMTGGIGGFGLAASLGYARQFTASYGPGFAIFAVLALVAWVGIAAVRIRWRQDAAMLATARI